MAVQIASTTPNGQAPDEAHVRSIFRKLELPTDSTQNRRMNAVLTFIRARTSQACGGEPSKRPGSPSEL